MTDTTDEGIIAAGMKCLEDALGREGALRFISLICNSDFDYTVQRRVLFDNMTHEELLESMDSYMKDNPIVDELRNRSVRLL